MLSKSQIDIFSFLITLFVIEFGRNSVIINDNCYQSNKYSKKCFKQLKKNIYIKFLKTKNMIFNEILYLDFLEKRNCDDFWCFVMKMLKYDLDELILHTRQMLQDFQKLSPLFFLD